jgi:hypothetical protein
MMVFYFSYIYQGRLRKKVSWNEILDISLCDVPIKFLSQVFPRGFSDIYFRSVVLVLTVVWKLNFGAEPLWY